MSDYKEQVNSLREHADLIETSIELYGPSATRLLVYDLRNAAAAIETLQAEVNEARQHNTDLLNMKEMTKEEEDEMLEYIRTIPVGPLEPMLIEQLPKRGEMVEVVRCKDCKHRPTGTGVNHDIEFPDAICPCQCYEDYWYSWMPSDDWYCGNGEKMEVRE